MNEFTSLVLKIIALVSNKVGFLNHSGQFSVFILSSHKYEKTSI